MYIRINEFVWGKETKGLLSCQKILTDIDLKTKIIY